MAATQSIRKAQKSDAPEIASIGLEAAPFQFTNGNPLIHLHADSQRYITEYWREDTVTKLIETQNKDMFVAYDQSGKITGFALLSRHDPCLTLPSHHPLVAEQWACLDSLFVHPDFHRQKTRTSLLKEVEGVAEQNGMEMMWLTVHEVNEVAQKFYLKHGYVEVSRSDFPDKNDITMVKNLKNTSSST